MVVYARRSVLQGKVESEVYMHTDREAVEGDHGCTEVGRQTACAQMICLPQFKKVFGFTPRKGKTYEIEVEGTATEVF